MNGSSFIDFRTVLKCLKSFEIVPVFNDIVRYFSDLPPLPFIPHFTIQI